jgi:RNA polymerase sigma-70 factor (ECF subfamily)
MKNYVSKYDKSRVMKRAYVILRKIDSAEYTDTTWSECLTQSWNIEKNGTPEIQFNYVYDKYYKSIFNFVMSKINYKSELAQELTQDIFIKLHRHIDNYDVYKASFKTWLYTIANRKVIDFYRTNKADKFSSIDSYVNAEGESTFQIEDESQNTSQGVENEHVNDRVKNAMSSLNDKEQKIATLSFMEQKQYNEIAEMLSIPMGSVKGTLNRIRTKLQEKLNNVYASI